jgi:hypothetical protein
VKAEFDAYGDGKSESIQGEERSYIYDRPGDYHPTLRIYNSKGLTYSETLMVKVLSREVFDAHIQAIWNDMKEALRRSDIPAALECIHTGSRHRYYEGLQEITNVQQKVDELFGPTKWVKIDKRGGAEATYRLTITVNGLERTGDVRFAIDVDGAWRLRELE